MSSFPATRLPRLRRTGGMLDVAFEVDQVVFKILQLADPGGHVASARCDEVEELGRERKAVGGERLLDEGAYVRQPEPERARIANEVQAPYIHR